MDHDTHPIVFTMLAYVGIMSLIAGALYVLVA